MAYLLVILLCNTGWILSPGDHEGKAPRTMGLRRLNDNQIPRSFNHGVDVFLVYKVHEAQILTQFCFNK